jgi:uncharacterized membrane protein
MTWYQLFLYLHIAGATVWVGGATMLQFMAMRARTRGLDGLVVFAADVGWIGKRVLGPASLAVIGAGVGMVVNGPWSFSDDWITIALSLVAVAYALVVGVMEPESKRVAEAIADGRLDEAQRRGRRQTIVSRIELAGLFLIVFDMAMKPTFADHGVIAYGIGGFALATVAVLLHGRLRSAPRRVAALDAA